MPSPSASPTVVRLYRNRRGDSNAVAEEQIAPRCMLRGAVGGEGVQHVIGDVAHQFRRKLPDRFIRIGARLCFVGRFQQQGHLLMLGELHWLQRAKYAAFVDGFELLGHGEPRSCLGDVRIIVPSLE